MHRFLIAARSALSAVLASLMIGALLPAYVAAGSNPVTFDLFMGSSCVSGHAEPGATIQILWKSGNGARKVRTSRVVDPGGVWEACKSALGVEPNDSVRANDGHTANAIVVPDLTLVQNRVDDVYRGHGPAGQYVRLTCRFSDGCGWSQKIKVSSTGKWSIRPGWDVRGNMRMTLSWRRGDDLVQLDNVSPYVWVTIGSALVRGAARNGAAFTVVDKKSNGHDVRGTANGTAFTFDGMFNSKFRNAAGDPVAIRIGDIIASDVATDVDWQVTDIPAAADSSTGRVTGNCGSHEGWVVLVSHDGQVIDGDSSYTDQYGNFEIYLSFQAGDRVELRCELVTGDWIGKFITAS